MSSAEVTRRALTWFVLPACLLLLVLGLAWRSVALSLWGGILALNAGIWLVVMSMSTRRDAARVQQMRAGDEVLARWEVDPLDWQEHAAGEWQYARRLAWRRTRTWGGSLAGTLVLVSIAGDFDLLRVQLPLAVFGFLLGTLGAVAISGASLLWNRLRYRPRTAPTEVVIGGTGVLYRGNYYNWEGANYLIEVTFAPGENAVLEFVIGTRSKKGETTPTVVRVPVPRGHEAEAAELAQRLAPWLARRGTGEDVVR